MYYCCFFLSLLSLYGSSLFLLYRISTWTRLDGTKPIQNLIMRIQLCALRSFGGCVFWEADKVLSTLQNKTNNFLKRWEWSKKCFQDHILGVGLLNFVWNLPWAPQTVLNTDLLDDCMEECWKADTECLCNAFIYAYSC